MPKTLLDVDTKKFLEGFRARKGMHSMSNADIGTVMHETGATVGNWMKDPSKFRFGAAQRLCKKWKCKIVIDPKGFHFEEV